MRDKNIVSFRGSWRERKFKNTNKKKKKRAEKMLFYIKTRDGRNASTNGSPPNLFCRSPIGRRLRVSRFGRGAPRRAAKLTLNFRARQKKNPQKRFRPFLAFFFLFARA